MMKFIVKKAQYKDIMDIMKIYEDAKKIMLDSGINQWSLKYPNMDIVKKDIEDENLYILVKGDEIIAVASVIFGIEPTYKKIYEGSWSSEEKYATIHRMAVAKNYKNMNMGQELFKKIKTLVLEKKYNWIRIDTHKDNLTMNKSISKAKFNRRGIIFVSDGTPRIAYDINIKAND